MVNREDDNDSLFQDDEGTEVPESLQDDSGHGGAPKKAPFNESEPEIGHLESRIVYMVRILVMVLLLTVTAGVAWGVYYYVSDSETKEFEKDFRVSSDKVLDSVGSTLDRSLGAIDQLMVTIVSHQQSSGSVWPNVTLPNFGVIAKKVLTLSKASVIGLYPRVLDAERDGWEAYAGENDEWVDQSLKTQREDPSFGGTNLDSWKAYPFIHSNKGPLPREEKYYPTWQASPVVPRYGAYGWDLYPFHWKELDALESERAVMMGFTLNVHTPGDDSDADVHKSTMDWISDLIGRDQDPTDPIFPIYYPVVEKAADAVDLTGRPAEEHKVVGVIATTIFWRELFHNILSPGSNGVIVVIGSCAQNFTYLINGPDAVYLGKGDRHDLSYDRYGKKVLLYELDSYTVRTRVQYKGFPLSTTFCPYWVDIYPSESMKDGHKTNNPLIYTIVAISIFAFTSLVFVVYDCVSEKRQRKVLQVAVQSHAVVSNLFPKVVHDRLFPATRSRPKEGVETAKLRLQQFLRHKGDETTEKSEKEKTRVPIAELFAETTVMFADIAGFTAWSSIREPAQVFILLETLYESFDRIALRRGVFKVETIGDSYVAVAGLPEPRPDHALVMAKFARGVREKMVELTRKLGLTLGPDTGDLGLRIGLHSGPVTAGVLRGDRSRFQLFGDTVNTAARMESTGTVGKIQVSESTANIILKSGKGHWLKKREGGVQAKGKGIIQTYWVEPNARQSSSSAGDSSDEDKALQLPDEQIRRLVDWNVEVMAKLLREIVVRREARTTQASGNGMSASSPKSKGMLGIEGDAEFRTILDEVVEVIMLPELEQTFIPNQKSQKTIKLDTAVIAQLREYVSLVASTYRNNPFHNFEHASHVTMSVVKLLSRIVAPTESVIKTAEEENHGDLVSTLHDHSYGITSDSLTQFSCVFSALIHDADHPGVPNSQLLKEDSPLVATYKGKSLAEQNSVDIGWKLLMENQFEDLRVTICATDTEMARFRQLVVNIVMATDIMDRDLMRLRDQRWDKAFQEENRFEGETMAVCVNRKATIVLEHLIQASDVAHTMQHWHIFRKWNERLFSEMYLAYRSGRAETNPADVWYKGELRFFDYYVIPLAKKLSDCGVFGVSSDEYLGYAIKNREEWELRGQEVVESMLANFQNPDKIESRQIVNCGRSFLSSEIESESSSHRPNENRVGDRASL